MDEIETEKFRWWNSLSSRIDTATSEMNTLGLDMLDNGEWRTASPAAAIQLILLRMSRSRTPDDGAIWDAHLAQWRAANAPIQEETNGNH